MSTSETMRFICGGCGYRARIPSSYTGKVILCPGCQQMQIAAADGGEATGDTVRIGKVATAQGGTGRFSVPEADGRLKFTCGGCGYSAKLAQTYAGKAISCPNCKSPQLIPPLQGADAPGAAGGGAGKAMPSPALEAATAPAADDGLTFDDEPAKPVASSPASDDGISFDDVPAVSAKVGDHEATKPTAVARPAAQAPATPTTKPGSGGVVRRGSRMAMPVAPPPGDEDDQDEAQATPAKPLPPWAQTLKEPRMMAILGGSLAALILLVVLISGWASAAGQAADFRQQAQHHDERATTLAKEKAAVEFSLSKTGEELNRLKKSEGDAKAALASAEARLAEQIEQLKKAEADKASEYALRKKAEADHDELFSKLKALEKKRDDDYRIATELRRKYEEEVKLRKDLKVRLDEAQAAAK